FAFLQNVGLKYHPDIVVLFFYPNDFADVVFNYPRYSLKDDGTIDPLPIMKERTINAPEKRNMIVAFLTRNLHSMVFLYELYKNPRSNYLFNYLLPEKEGAMTYLETKKRTVALYAGFDFTIHSMSENYNVVMEVSIQKIFALFKAFEQESKKHNFKFVVVNIPSRYQFNVEETEKMFAPGLADFYKEVGGKFIPDKQNKLFRTFFDAQNISYVDLFYVEDFSNNTAEMYFKRNVHTNKKGNEVIARAVHDKLSAVGYDD
ncbi:hypothetical protein HY485_02205, partial [Candidatus Woesearchaeota archaeon]|nr:hypothetical protein [Candidatus Woesearchaeota archaeon]